MASLLVWSIAPSAAAEGPAPSPAAGYDRDIRPILSNYCFKCHGPDAAERKSGLRLDVQESAFGPAESGLRAIVPGKADESELVRRVMSSDPDVMMPPPDSGKQLSAGQKQVLQDWVAGGAAWRRHWSFVTPERPALPKVKLTEWPRGDLDRFILARLEAEGLQPSPEADKATLLRRVTLDLTGLPPTLAELDAFLADDSPSAYEKAVDRLLASPRYGERLALEWLDAARYADTHGYHIDSHRDMWPWRDWVIGAFNRNMPFDQFTIEQLAGDLLPNASLEQQIASGFNRNHMINFEGGAIPEEYHTAYIVDRVNTASTVWLGLTVACAQCHDHKFDPLTQKEFYQLYAYFHNVPEKGLDGRKGNAAPLIRVPSSTQQQELDRLAAEIARLKGQIAAPPAAVDLAQAEWEKTALVEKPIDWLAPEPIESTARGGAALTRLDDGSLLASGNNPAKETYTVTIKVASAGATALRLETLPDDSLSAKGPGRSVNGNLVLSEVRVTIAKQSEPAASKPLKIKRATADFSQKDFPIANVIDGKPATGWAIYPEVGKPHAAVFEFESPLKTDGPALLTATLEFQSDFGQHQAGRIRLALTNSAEPHGKESLPESLREILSTADEDRSAEQRTELKKHYRQSVSPLVRQLNDELAALEKSHKDLDALVPTAMVMQEMPQPRDTFLLVRGQYDKKGEQVQPGVPAALPPLPAGAPANRLGLAQWLVQPSHPLTGRVIVNRYWQMCFGTGLVKTSEDFGSQGEWPSHPALLDWLATEFTGTGWDVKRLLKSIVMSATYRQSSKLNAMLVAKDPENRLLARGPRWRLQAEFIRDQALAVSGLMNPAIGGKSVYPYQPPGLWEEMAFGKEFTAQRYTPSQGPDLYRRSMYTFWKRTVPPATMSTFDAPDRETCTVRRLRTNTPLQALVLMNDPTYIEAARKLAERLLSEAGSSPAERIALAFRLATARLPRAAETAVLEKIYVEQLARYRNETDAAIKLLSVGESPRNERLDAAELAAWTMVASVILNLDETITKG